LPFKHKYTATKEEALTAYFIPCTKIMKDRSFFDKRGYVDEENALNYWNGIRASYAEDPTDLVTLCAEYCLNGEEAFSLEGDNKFNKANIAEQLTAIRALKQCPPIDTGIFRFTYKGT
jgi:hypothetical protein